MAENLRSEATTATIPNDESRLEPISGASGDVSKGEPFDAGNMAPHDQARLKKSMDGESRRPERNETDIKPPGENTGNSEEIPEEIDSDDLTGPGPRPLIDIAKENGGDAGASEGSASESSDSLGKDNVPSDSVPESGRDQGTGEKYVKSTGVAADGGNFDATQPGAGREADRLMEEKGLKPCDGNPQSESSSHGDEKPNMIERIKNKLHKH